MRRILAISAIVVAVLLALVVLWRDGPNPPDTPRPTPVAALPTDDAPAAADAEAVASPDSDADNAPALAVLSPYDNNPDWAHGLDLPRDPATDIPALLARVEDGDHAAAELLFMHTWHCSPHQPVPRNAAQLEQHRNRIVQRRPSPSGLIRDDWEAALDELDVLYRLCRYIDEQDVAPHTHWVTVAAELGSLEAMTRYWSVQQSAIDLADSPPAQAEIEAMHTRAVGYLERARDAGYVDAFFTIALLKGASVPGPYEQDGVGALGHFYANRQLRTALIEQRRASQFYEGRHWLEAMDQAQLEMVERLIRQMELRVHVYQHREARELAERLLARCCR